MEELYVPPQITYDEEIDDLLDDYMNDYRRVYIEHPRIRLDGVHIAVCHYMCVHHPQWNIFLFHSRPGEELLAKITSVVSDVTA